MLIAIGDYRGTEIEGILADVSTDWVYHGNFGNNEIEYIYEYATVAIQNRKILALFGGYIDGETSAKLFNSLSYNHR